MKPVGTRTSNELQWFHYRIGYQKISTNNSDDDTPYRFISQTHNALDKRHTIHDFVTEMCTRVHISATKWRIVGHGTGAFLGIYATGLLWKLDLQISYDERPGGGVTKPIFSVPLFPQIFRMIKTAVTCMISSSYLAGVTASALRRQLANMNMIESIWPTLLLNQNFP